MVAWTDYKGTSRGLSGVFLLLVMNLLGCLTYFDQSTKFYISHFYIGMSQVTQVTPTHHAGWTPRF